MKDYIIYSPEYPAHYSVGAVVLDPEDRVMCHHFTKIAHFQDLYVLMRETPKPDESIEETLSRGLLEEFGASAEIVHYLGSIVSRHSTENIENIEKTTLYFLCQLREFYPERRLKDDRESSSEILFLPAEDLIAKISSQTARYPERTDLDERIILERLKLT